MTEFKEGDEVIITGHHFNDGTEVDGLQYIIGKRGVIKDASGLYLQVEIDGTEDRTTIWGILASDMKLASGEFKVGDKVRVKDDADKSASGRSLRGEVLTIEEINDHGDPDVQYFTSVEKDDSGIWLSEVERVEETKEEPVVSTVPHGTVEKQTHIKVKEGNIAVAHVTNSKRNRVSILKTGTAVGHIKFDDIDTLISLLTRLKEEV